MYSPNINIIIIYFSKLIYIYLFKSEVAYWVNSQIGYFSRYSWCIEEREARLWSYMLLNICESVDPNRPSRSPQVLCPTGGLGGAEAGVDQCGAGQHRHGLPWERGDTATPGNITQPGTHMSETTLHSELHTPEHRPINGNTQICQRWRLGNIWDVNIWDVVKRLLMVIKYSLVSPKALTQNQVSWEKQKWN